MGAAKSHPLADGQAQVASPAPAVEASGDTTDLEVDDFGVLEEQGSPSRRASESSRGGVNRASSMTMRRQQWLVFHHESVRSTALRVKEIMGGDAELSMLEWKHFDDGFPDLQIQTQDARRLEQFYGTCLIVSFHSPEVIFEQLCLMHELPRTRAKNFHIILPWFSTGTKERVEALGQIATAKTLADLLSLCPPGPGGPATLVTFDIHWMEEQFYFGDRLLVELKSAMSLGLAALERARQELEVEIAVAFPDDGAYRKMQDVFGAYRHRSVVCDKVRDGDKRIVTVREGAEHVPGRHCVVVDDMVMSGALMLECAAQLFQMGASHVSCLTVHAVMPQGAYKKFLGKGLYRFWITDTVPSTAALVQGQEPFEVLTIAPLIAGYLRGNF